MNKLKHCPICGSSHFEEHLATKDHMITQESFNIVKCKDCSFLFTNPIPSKEAIGRYYKSEDYVSHSSSNKGFINWLYGVVRKITLKQKVNWVKKYSAGKKLLDIGCGTGHFIATANNAGFNCIGLEPDDAARRFAIDVNKVNAQPLEVLKNTDNASVDVITMWHVLEHVYDLKADVLTISNVLKDKGVLFVAVPNCSAFDAAHYKDFWAAYDVPRHLYHFQQKNIVDLFQQVQMEVVEVIPMKFDAYYVSMLSEKYKKGNLWNAFIVGLKSNLKAKKHGYSSQVYVLRKQNSV